VQRGFGIERFDSEGRSIIADYGDFILCNIYFPNGQMSPERLAYKLDFYESFLDYADRLQKSGRGVIVCGDVNTAHREIDLARPKENAKTSGFLPQERAWIDKLLSHGFVDTFRIFNTEPAQYTWWDLKSRARERNVGWRIDYFFVSAALQDRVRAAIILPQVMGSDHCPVGLEISL
jgi:exodeoxyribonuclease-3